MKTKVNITYSLQAPCDKSPILESTNANEVMAQLKSNPEIVLDNSDYYNGFLAGIVTFRANYKHIPQVKELFDIFWELDSTGKPLIYMRPGKDHDWTPGTFTPSDKTQK